MLLEEFLVLLLDVPRITQHHCRQILGRIRAVHRPAVSLFIEERDAPDVIHVGMTEDDRVDIRHLEGKCGILLCRLLPPPLEEPAVEEHAAHLTRRVLDLQFMTGTGDFLRSSMRNKLHTSCEYIAAPLAHRSFSEGGWEMNFINALCTLHCSTLAP